MTEKEFTYFSQKQRAKLTAIANKLVRGADRAEEVEDIVQETLASLWNLLQDGYPAKDPETIAKYGEGENTKAVILVESK